MADFAARPMNIHQQASTPYRHSSGKDIAGQQWHLIAIEDARTLAKSHLIAIGNASFAPLTALANFHWKFRVPYARFLPQLWPVPMAGRPEGVRRSRLHPASVQAR
jgi:hypothetical protein